MSYQLIELPQGQSHYDATVDLEDRGSYIWEFKFNTQDESWYLNIFDAQKNPIAYSLHVVTGTLIGRRVRHPLFQTGVLIAIDTAGPGNDAKLNDLGTRVVLYYLTDLDYMAAMQRAGGFAP